MACASFLLYVKVTRAGFSRQQREHVGVLNTDAFSAVCTFWHLTVLLDGTLGKGTGVPDAASVV